MSTTENQVYLESKKEKFDQAIEEERFVSAAEIIDEIKAKGFMSESTFLSAELKKQVDEYNFQEAREAKLSWLHEKGRLEADIMTDATGEYVLVEEEEGLKKAYLPDFKF